MARGKPLLRGVADFRHACTVRAPGGQHVKHPSNYRPRPGLQAVEPGRCPTHAQRCGTLQWGAA